MVLKRGMIALHVDIWTEKVLSKGMRRQASQSRTEESTLAMLDGFSPSYLGYIELLVKIVAARRSCFFVHVIVGDLFIFASVVSRLARELQNIPDSI